MLYVLYANWRKKSLPYYLVLLKFNRKVKYGLNPFNPTILPSSFEMVPGLQLCEDAGGGGATILPSSFEIGTSTASPAETYSGTLPYYLVLLKSVGHK